jgi:hypothetical protein
MSQAILEVTELFRRVKVSYSPDSLVISYTTKDKEGNKNRVVHKSDEAEDHVLSEFHLKWLVKPYHFESLEPYEYIQLKDDGMTVCGEFIALQTHMRDVYSIVDKILTGLTSG